jgi:dipeptidyl aminopeptidase/acylaminoacyl peptidase
MAFVAAYAVAGAQAPSEAPAPAQAPASSKRAIAVDDYTKWKSIGAQEISGDGQWVAYVVSGTNVPPADAKPVLHLLNLSTNQRVEVADATAPAFSSDSKWLAYSVEPGAGARGRGGRGGGGAGGAATPPAAPGADTPAPEGQAARGAATPPAAPRRAELRNLATGAVKSWQDIQSFAFNANATHLMLRRRPPQPAGRGGEAGGGAAGGGAPGGGGGGGADAPAGPRGVDVTIHNLGTGRDQLVGSVGDMAFNKSGALVAYTVDATVRDSNGLFALELATSRVHALDNDAKVYSRLTWNETGTALAVLKGADVEKMRERQNVLLAFPDIAATLGDGAAPGPVVLDPAKADGFPKDWVVSDRATLAWSDDRQRVFFGMKEQVPVASNPRRNTDESADVDVWNTTDERIQSQQMIRAEQDRNFTFRQAFDVAANRFVKLADESMRELEVAADGRWAVGRDTRGYIHDVRHAAADVYRVNTSTGERTLMFKGLLLGAHAFGISPQGRHFLYWKDARVHAYDLDAGTSRMLGGAAGPNFTDLEFDHPGPKPSYGIAGYTTDGTAVIAQHRYDLWQLPLDGSAARNLTGGLGAKNEIRFRYVRTIPIDADAAPGAPGPPGGPAGGRGGGAGRPTIDLSKPVTLSAYGEWTKKAGFYELTGGQMREIVFEDAVFSTPMRAAKAETYLFTRQTFVDFPNLRVSGPDFKASRAITDVNPHQTEFLWGRRILFDYKNKGGVRLQGILAVPDDYKPGERRPMIVTFYEKNSQNLHRYNAPSYLTGMGSSPMQAVSEGYLTMLPDVHFNTGSSHSDMLDCVEAAVKKVIEMGYADPKRIGLNGHSYGGEGAAFIGTRSKMFAVVGMGAGVTDLYSDFSQSWGWTYQVTGGSGANGNNYYIYGQGRWGVSPWDDPELYHFESALTHVKDVAQPFLIMHGTADPTVSFTEGMNFYNALRYNGKTATMLAYPGEGHGLRGMANRKDLTIRFFEYFNHYLKGAPAAKWMTDGVPFLRKR